MECNIEKMKKVCTCTYPCDKRGKCCECVTYHRKRGEFPGCFFTPEGEKLYDRSFECLMKYRRGAS
jgi:hypothetical protein